MLILSRKSYIGQQDRAKKTHRLPFLSMSDAQMCEEKPNLLLEKLLTTKNIVAKTQIQLFVSLDCFPSGLVAMPGCELL